MNILSNREHPDNNCLATGVTGEGATSHDREPLGSSPEVIVNMLRPLNLTGRTTRVLDLGCGKGAVAITLAKELGLRVFGADLFLPFVREAGERAKESGVADRCRFACCDLCDTVLKAKHFDVVIYAAVGNVLGSLDQCVKHLRQCVRPGGYMIIDDGFAKGEKSVNKPGYEYIPTHDEALRHLTACGDVLLQEVIVPQDEIKAYNRRNNEVIQKRAEMLARLHPEEADLLAQYVKRQIEECEILETQVVGAVWLLQRTM
ncbi:MAG: class I SAM-dependent methyltransferase [Candidatus Lindowbacteria bacterium]|nr:class I SAM-dependent methyltransferase [Candidatus Lindowbacteria bacterium]